MSGVERHVFDPNRGSVVWFARDAIAMMRREAERTFPNESGGVLLGYSDATNSALVVTAFVGPGPLARHGRSAFVPDHRYHEEQVAQIYSASGRVHSYLGDWHSHPDGSLRMSAADRRTLARIARFREARMSRPIMVVIAGRPARHVIEPLATVGSRDETIIRLAEWQLSTWRVSATPSAWAARIGYVALVRCSLRELE